MEKFVAIFPGQGSQFIGMGKALYDEYKIFRDTVDEAEKVSGVEIRKLCFDGPLSVLSKPENAHIAIVTYSVAAFRVFVSETGLLPEFCAGHSLGEYAALVCAGVIKFSDALKLIKVRCEISQEIRNTNDSGMTIVDCINTDKVKMICDKQQSLGKQVYVSCFNSLTQTAISGIEKDLIETERILSKESGVISPLFNSAPFHCPLMNSGVEYLNEILDEMEFQDLRYPVMSNYTGKPYSNIGEVKRYLLNHLTNPVKWNDIISYFSDKSVELVIDFSAKNIFENMISKDNKLEIMCFGNKLVREKFFEKCKTERYVKHKPNFISKCILVTVSTPNINFNIQEYQEGVVNNYNKLIEIESNIQKDNNMCLIEDKIKAINLLKAILECKQVEINEQKWWLNKILDETASTYDVLV